MNKRQKIKKDQRTLRLYEKQLRNRRQEIGRQAEAYSLTGRKQRIAAIGESVLKLLEDLHRIQDEQQRKGKPLLNGTLFWGINEERVQDTDGKKGFHYRLFFMVKSEDAYYTEEQIRKELRETYAKLKAETDEMYGGVTDEEYLEET